MNTTDAGTNSRRGSTRRRTLTVLLAVTVTVAAGVGAASLVNAAASHKRPHVPSDSEVEGKSGIRITRVSLAADGGLLDVRYVVLNPTLATEWTGNTDKPPVLDNERTHQSFDRVAAMREGHDLRPGQTYYLIYLNKDGNVKRGDKIDMNIAGTALTGIPVE